MKSQSAVNFTRFVVIAALVLALALVPAAIAGRGGNGGGSDGGGGGKPAPSTGAALSGVVSGNTYTVTGTGFNPGEVIALTLYEAGSCCSATNAVPDGNGSFTYVGTLVGSGSYTVKASRYDRGRWRPVAEWSFVA